MHGHGYQGLAAADGLNLQHVNAPAVVSMQVSLALGRELDNGGAVQTRRLSETHDASCISAQARGAVMPIMSKDETSTLVRLTLSKEVGRRKGR